MRAGLAFYGLATILMFAPATLDGFVTPLLGARCGAASFACRSDLPASLAFEWALIQAFTKVSLAVQALGLLSWSAALALTSCRGWWAGLVGILISLAPLAMLGTMTRPIDPHSLARIIAFESVWAIGAAVMLWSDRVALVQERRSPPSPAIG